MKIRLILIGMVASLALPLAAADAQTAFDSGPIQAAAGTSLERGAAQTADSLWRQEDDDKGDKGRKCDEGDKDDDCKCDDHGDRGEKCEKSPDKPH